MTTALRSCLRLEALLLANGSCVHSMWLGRGERLSVAALCHSICDVVHDASLSVRLRKYVRSHGAVMQQGVLVLVHEGGFGPVACTHAGRHGCCACGADGGW